MLKSNHCDEKWVLQNAVSIFPAAFISVGKPVDLFSVIFAPMFIE